MRRSALLLLLSLLVACGGPGAEQDPAPDPTPSSPSSSPETDGEQPDGQEPDESSPGAAAPARTPACAVVRAGIDAFNEGDFEETVARFGEAVPLAEEQVDGSEQADQLLEAVRWYAALPPEDYAEAAVSSQEFQVYKAITLTQCDPVPDEAAPSTAPPVEA
ncbi:hypothetical protein [Nocardioides sp. AX2bis]|uniref:hypothetical protein n=1 Tax=Nocardioides sp. AX2bis TaxID=2653157 RepID=UPI00135721FD|nr:hypothetical protein [Nocardioides sp. AX2bis]